jgi:hypothetical protein
VAVACLSNHVDVVLILEQSPKASAYEGVVIG